MKRKILAAVCGAALLAAQPVLAQNLVWKDQTVQTADKIRTLAVYDLSALDILNSLGVKAQVVPDAKFPATLKAYNNSKAVKAGSLFEPDTAKLTAAKPDLIIIGGRSSRQQENMAAIAPTLNLTADTAHYMGDLQARTKLLADTFGKQKAAERKLKAVADKQVKLKAQTQGKSAIMIFAAGGNFMPHAEGERFGFVYELAGLKSTVPAPEAKAPNAAPPAPPKKPEEMTAAEKAEADKKRAEMQAKTQARLQAAVDGNPDYIIILDRGAVPDGKYTAPESVQTDPVLGKSKAKFIFVDANAWYLVGAGLDNTELMLDELLTGTR